MTANSSDSRLPRAPRHLSADAKKWWKYVVATYELAPEHVRLLRLASEAWDRAQQARETLQEQGTYYNDRFGQPRTHPAVAVERDSRAAFAKLLRQLDLEGEPDALYRRRG